MLQWILSVFRKRKSTKEIGLTNRQFNALQQLSFSMSLEEQRLQRYFPELSIQWNHFLMEDGDGWTWYPLEPGISDEKLKELVNSHPNYFEIIGELSVPKNGAYTYRLYGHAIIDGQQQVIRRGKVSIEIQPELNDKDFLDELAKL